MQLLCIEPKCFSRSTVLIFYRRYSKRCALQNLVSHIKGIHFLRVSIMKQRLYNTQYNLLTMKTLLGQHVSILQDNLQALQTPFFFNTSYICFIFVVHSFSCLQLHQSMYIIFTLVLIYLTSRPTFKTK
jgi:hypothetical protein